MTAALALAVLAGCDNGSGEPPPPTTYTVTFDANGGSVTPGSLKVDEGKTVSTLPEPTKASQYFWGWYVDKDAWKTPFNLANVVRADITVYARWSATEATWYTVTFDADGGLVKPESLKVIEKEVAGSLPVPAKAGYTFGGWRTAKKGGGTPFTAETTVTASITVYAQWTAANSGDSGPKLPESAGKNELGEKSATISKTYTFYVDGSYEISSTSQLHTDYFTGTVGNEALPGGGDKPENKFVRSSGAYSYNSTSTPKTVSIKTLKVAGHVYDSDHKQILVGESEFKKQLSDTYSAMSQNDPEWGYYNGAAWKAEADAYIKRQGYSNVTAYINAVVKELFAVTTFEYDFFDESQTLVFLQETLPAKTASIELRGKSAKVDDYYYGTYTFAQDTATYTKTTTSDYSKNETGSYLADASSKTIYFKPDTIDNKTPKQYYAGLDYDADDAEKAASTNSAFRTYNPFIHYSFSNGTLVLTNDK